MLKSWLGGGVAGGTHGRVKRDIITIVHSHSSIFPGHEYQLGWMKPSEVSEKPSMPTGAKWIMSIVCSGAELTCPMFALAIGMEGVFCEDALVRLALKCFPM